MPFALVPDGFKLQKVTKLQKEAIDKYNSSQNIQAFFEGPASSELVKAVTIVVTPIVLAALAKRGFEFAEQEVKDIITSTTETVTGVGDDLLIKLADSIINITGVTPPISPQQAFGR
tara:strand:+ start:84 stop:434 length:351 start_codon:yes stop_codon:yes gene_type:complete